jgi:hypothetical protein
MENEALENEEISDRAFRELKFISYLKIPTKVNSKKDLFNAIFIAQMKIAILVCPKAKKKAFEYIEDVFDEHEDIFDEQEKDYREEYSIYFKKRYNNILKLKD